jgi:sulfur carrier protein ThiS
MATISDLVAKLKLRAHIDQSERLSPSGELDDFLSAIINDAVGQHNPQYTVPSLPAAEEMLVLLLAQIEICYVRAEQKVNDAPIQAGGGAFVQNQDSPFNKNMKLARELVTRYNELVAKLGVSSGTGVVVVQTSVYKKSDRLDRIFPYFSVPAAPAPILTGEAVDSTTVHLSLVMVPVEYFYRYYIFWGLTPGLYQDWNAIGNMTVPRIKSSASLLIMDYDQTQQAVEAEDFPANTALYFMAVIQTQQNKYTYSDEILVTTPA